MPNNDSENMFTRLGSASLQEMVNALTTDYDSVLLVDLESDSYVSYRISREIMRQLGNEISGRSFEKDMASVARRLIFPQDREDFLQQVAISHLREVLRPDQVYKCRFRVRREDLVEYHEMKAALSRDHGTTAVIGFGCVDEEVRLEMVQKKVLEGALEGARNANAEKRMFLSNMSHDMRTPMNAIIGFTNMALHELDNTERTRDCLTRILESSELMMGLLGNVLEMSKIEEGQLVSHKEPADLLELCRQSTLLLIPAAHKKKINLTLSFQNIRHRRILCDETRTREVIMNIVSNAVKYTGEGGRVRCVFQELPHETGGAEGQGSYLFTCRDNGIGMSREFIERIYEPFAREQDTTASGIPGTGLGMSITRSYIEAAGGTIDITSEKGHGTCVSVSITLPLAPELPADPLTGPARDEFQKDILQGKRVLIVEDNELNREILDDILKEMGAETEHACNGKQAVERVSHKAAGSYDLILMDVMMPEMDGCEATLAIRQLPDPDRQAIPVIAMTASILEKDRQRAVQSGMNGYIEKPVDIGRMEKEISRVLMGEGIPTTGEASRSAAAHLGLQNGKLLKAVHIEMDRTKQE